MAELNTEEGGGGKGRHTKKRAKKSSTKVDMTPMVDLAFLLLTFFMLATTFSKPKTLEITFPKESTDVPTKINQDLATTILIGESIDTVYYYNGMFRQDTTELNELLMGKDGLRKFLLNRNSSIDQTVTQLEEKYKKNQLTKEQFEEARKTAKNDKEAPFVIVKTTKNAKYKTVIDVIDELNITNVGKYAVVDISDPELFALYTKTRPGLVTLTQ